MLTLSSRLRAIVFATAFLGSWLGAVPTITQQPGVVNATGGTTASLTVAATGAGALTYQWRRIGIPILGAEGATFTIANFGPGDAGAYDVVVSDGPSSSTTSQPGWFRYRSAPGMLWGAGYAPSFGIGASSRRDTARVIASDVARVAAGYNQSFFVKTDGTLWACGANYSGMLGDGTKTSRWIPVQVATDVAQVAPGCLHTLILKRDGSVWAVGSNQRGQLGNNSTIDSLTPVWVANGAVGISAGYDQSAFIKADGSLWMFGGNASGELGDRSFIDRWSPVFVAAGVKRVSAGAFGTVFIKIDGSLWSTGSGYNEPAQIDTGVTSIAADCWSLLYLKTDGSLMFRDGFGPNRTPHLLDTGVVAVAARGWGNAACYLKADGSMLAYGAGGSAGAFQSPWLPGELVANEVTSAESGANHFLYTTRDGTLWSLGDDGSGQLADGNSRVQPFPASITNGVVAAAGGVNCFALKSDGALWGMGPNGEGELGDGTTVGRTTTAVSATGVTAVAEGAYHTLFTDTAGQLWATGGNGYSQLGDGTATNRTTPVPIAAGVVTFAAGDYHSLFVTADAQLWAMGSNSCGQLGSDYPHPSYSPTSVASGIVAVAAGANHSLFLKTDGSIWAMGDNRRGQLGDGSTATERHTPVPVATGGIAVAAFGDHSLFLKRDGTLWAMGSNAYGQLGDGTTTDRSTPVPIATGVVVIATSRTSSLFLKADATLWSVGDNACGQLGDGTLTERHTPVQIASHVTGIAAGGAASLFIQQPGFGTAPTFSTQPQSAVVAPGATHILSAVAAGTGPVDYQWIKEGVPIAGARSPQLPVVFASAVDAGTYTVVATNAAGTVTSLPATLAIGPVPAVSPADLTVVPGATANFSVAASGTGTLRYQWFKDGVALAGQTGGTLSLTNVQRGDVGYYRVVVTDDYSSTSTADASLNLPSFPIAAAATDQLALGAAFDGTNYLVAIQGGSSNSTACTAQLVAPNGTLVGSPLSIGRNGGQAGFGLGAMKAAFGGSNYLLVWSDNAAAPVLRLYGAFVSPAGALVGAPFAFPVASGATTQQRPEGIAFDGTRFLIVYSDGESKPWKLCGRFVTPAGAVGAEMVLAANMVGSFQSVASNGNRFLVVWPASLGNSTSIIQGRFVSGTGTLSDVFAIDPDPSPSYNPVGVASDGTDFLVAWNHDTGSGYPAPTVWELRSRIVTAAGALPAAPVVFCTNVTDPVLPAVTFNGSSYLIAWTQLFGGGALENTTALDVAGGYFDRSGAPRGPAFNLVVGPGNQAFTPVAAGNGNCLVVYNELGAPFGGSGPNSVRGVLLTNLTPPTISAQPVSQNFSAGSTATFTVTAAGSDLTYQWSRDGAAIPGARGATLAVANVQPASFGNYTVTVSNPTGSVTSEPALLGVVGVGGTKYRLLDYFYPLVVGNEWLYLGPDYGPTKTHTRRRLVDLDRAITGYTGGAEAIPVAQRAVAVLSEFGVASAGGFTPAEEWTDYFACNGVSFGFYGDDEEGPHTFRSDGGLSFAPALAVGEAFVAAGNAYGEGVWNGRMVLAIRLLGLETVTVPAGTYPNCLHIRYSFAGAGTDELNDEWWFPGIGAVKHQDRDPGEPIYERNLLSFTVAQPVPPAITAQPAGVTIALGATASLGVTTNGTAPLSYQWYRGESGDTASPIVGATTANFVTPALTAWARYWVRVANRSSYADSATALIEVTGGTMTVGDWAAQGGVPANQRGPLATPAGDGVTNLMKFALGVPPLASATAHLPTATTYTQAGQPLSIALLFTKNPGAQGIDYVLEVSDNMVTWTEVARVIEVLGTNPDGTQLVRMREAVPPAAVRRFARLKIEMRP